MPKLWLNIGGIFLIIACLIYADHLIRLHASWSWDDFFHHETFIGIAGSLGIMLLIVAIVDSVTKKSRR